MGEGRLFFVSSPFTCLMALFVFLFLFFFLINKHGLYNKRQKSHKLTRGYFFLLFFDRCLMALFVYNMYTLLYLPLRLGSSGKGMERICGRLQV